MIDDQQSDEQILKKYQRDFGKKICIQRDFTFTYDEREKKLYTNEKFNHCGQKSLIVCAIITVILICGGIYFAISRNEGYKALKFIIEKNITSISFNFPNEDQIRKLALFLNNSELNDDIYFINSLESPCNYEQYQQFKCHYSQFIKYCIINNNHAGQCADINFTFYQNLSFSYCLLGKPSTNEYDTSYSTYSDCSFNQEYLKFLKDYGRIIDGIPENLVYSASNTSNDVTISYIRGFTWQKLWCDIGKFDMSILISSLVFILIYIVVLFLDICNGEKRTIGIKYYITLIGYMILYPVLIIFIVLYLILFAYSVFVFLAVPNTYVYDYSYSSVNELIFDQYFFKKKETEDVATGLWKEKRLYAAVFCGINLLIFIFVCVLNSIRKIIYSFLSFSNQIVTDINNLKEVKRKTSIKVDKNYDIIIFQNENLILSEIETNKIYEFKKIIYNNKEYYLKVTNKGLKDQTDWTDFYKYPKVNECFLRLVSLFKLTIPIISILIISKKIQIEDEFTYSFYKYLFQLGYRPKFYEYFDKFGEMHKDMSDLLFTLYIIIAILIYIPIVKRAFFGGFANVFLSLGSFILSIIFCIVNLILTILLVYTMVYLIFSFIAYMVGKVSFNDDYSLMIKLFMYLYIYFYSFLFLLIYFFFSITLSKCLFNIIIESNILGFSKSRKEDIFIFMGFDQNQHILEIDNSNDLPNKLFYTLKNNPNQLDNNIAIIPKKEENKQLCLELNKDEFLKESEQNDYISYIKKRVCRSGIIGNSLYLIIIGGFIFVFEIIAFSTLIKNNKNYDAYRQYLISIEKFYSSSFSNSAYNSIASASYSSTSNFPSFARLWCKFANYESGVLVSYFIFIIIYIVFEVLSFLHHNKTLQIIDIKNEISNKIILLINIIFYVLFMIFSPLLLYLFIYSILVTALSPLQFKNGMDIAEKNNPFEESWNKIENKISLIIKCIIVLIIFILNLQLTNIKYSIIRYINKKYDENSNNENNNTQNNDNNFENKNNNNNINNINIENNNTNLNNIESNNINNENNNKNNIDYANNNKNVNNINENIFNNIELKILNTDYKAHIKINENLYLKDIFSDNIYKFIRIKINNIINEYIYLKLGINSITDQVSIGEWDYPIINETFNQLSSLCKQIYALLFLSIPLFQLHVNDEQNYLTNISLISNLNMGHFGSILDKKPIFYSIFASYGTYEKGLNVSRFVFYTINIVILLLFMLYRIYYGGFKKKILYDISFFICIYFILQNVIYILLNFFLLIFTGLSISSYYNGFADLKDDMIQAKLIIQSAFIIPIFAINMSILICSIKFCLHINAIRKDLNKNPNENKENLEKPKEEIKFISLNGDICILKEIIDQRLERDIYYSLINENLNILNCEENKALNINNEIEIMKSENRKLQIENNGKDSKELLDNK